MTTSKLANYEAKYILVFIDGSKKYINTKAYDIIWNSMAKGQDIIGLGNQMINLKTIKVMESLEEYYNQYPKERPPVYDDFKQKIAEDQGFAGIINKHKDNKKALKEMIKGLEGYINSKRYKGTNAPKELLALMNNALNKA